MSEVKTGAATVADLRAMLSNVPFADHMGLVLTRFEGGISEMRYDVQPEHLNHLQVAHGGACLTLLDVTMATAARSLRPEQGVVTVEMKTTFMRPASGSLVGRGTVLQATGRMAFTEGRIEDAEGRLCAHATGTFKYVPRAPTSAAD
jgi:uncharacterized protein (TIGR00369 family)